MGRTMARFVQKWGPEVRELVEAAALDPKRPSARQIHEGLIASATGEGGALSPSDIPPRATIAQWVTEARRDARAVITGTPAEFDQLAARLMTKLRGQVASARTPDEISRCAKAARELAGLHRDLNRPEPAKPGPKARASLPDAPSPTHAQDTSRSDDEREFLKRLEDDASV
jgi:hypothetical protein